MKLLREPLVHFLVLGAALFVRREPAYGIGSLATFWMIERVVGFWS